MRGGQFSHLEPTLFAPISIRPLHQTLLLPALAVNWGVWSEVGMAKAAGVVEALARRGWRGLTNAEGLKHLETALTLPHNRWYCH